MLFSTMHTYFFYLFFSIPLPSLPKFVSMSYVNIRHESRDRSYETCQRNSISDTLEHVKWHRHDRLQRHPASFLNIRSNISSVDSSRFFSQRKVKWDRAREFFLLSEHRANPRASSIVWFRNSYNIIETSGRVKNSIVLIVIIYMDYRSRLTGASRVVDGDLARDWMEGGTERKKRSIWLEYDLEGEKERGSNACQEVNG